jgi:hypothetical protein
VCEIVSKRKERAGLSEEVLLQSSFQLCLLTQLLAQYKAQLQAETD